MAKILLSQTLIRSNLRSQPPNLPISFIQSASVSSRLSILRHRSSRSGKPNTQAQLIEIELGSEGDVDVVAMRKLEDAIHRIIAHKSAPDWLPFLPGYSYWVPPRRQQALGIAELIGKLTNPMSEEEALSLTTFRGWPSYAYFVEGASSHPVETESNKTAKSEEEDG